MYAREWSGGGRRFESVRGLRVSPCLADASVVSTGGGCPLRRSRSVHQRPPWTLTGAQLVEQTHRVFASVADEVAVVAVDHRQTGAHVAGEVESRDAGTEREGGEGVSTRRSQLASWFLISNSRPEMRKDVREFIRRFEAVGLTVESTPGH